MAQGPSTSMLYFIRWSSDFSSGIVEDPEIRDANENLWNLQCTANEEIIRTKSTYTGGARVAGVKSCCRHTVVFKYRYNAG